MPEFGVVSSVVPTWLELAQRTNSQASSFLVEPVEMAQPKPASRAAVGVLFLPPTGS